MLSFVIIVSYFISQLDSNPALFIKAAVKPFRKYTPTRLPKDTLKLFEFRGKIASDTAFVFVQGGPALKRNIDENNPLLLLPNSEHLLRIHPIQTQMMNSTVLRSKSVLTEQQGDFEHDLNVEILHRTITYLKSRNKTVYVICHSYGTLIGNQYLNKHKNKADNIALMGFPLDMDLKSFDANRGEIIRWKDGIIPIKESPFPPFPLKSLINESLNHVFANMFMLFNNGRKRFTKLLEDKDLHNVTYVYGKFDEASGRPTDSELKFLKSKAVSVVETFGDHYSMWTNQFMENLYAHITKKDTLKKSIVSDFANIIENEGLNNGLAWFEQVKKSTKYSTINEDEMNFYGYQFLDSNKVLEAIEIFKLNTELFPNSSNAFDSLAEAYLKDGNQSAAIVNYKKALQIDPENSNASEALKELQ